jgi:ATP-dependent helicase/nuclease subunit A
MAYYRPQIRMYKTYWEQITGETVKEAGIYFTSLDKWITIT